MTFKAARSLAATFIGLGLAGLGLAGCGQASHGGAQTAGDASGLCSPFKGDSAPAPAANSSAAVDECLHRWGYALATAREPAEVVAAATLTACSGAVAGWNQQTLNQAGPPPPDAESLTTGEPTNPMAEHAQFAQSQALFYVIQARAGKCAAPPSRLLVRPGQ